MDTITTGTNWLNGYGPAEYDATIVSKRPVLTVEEAEVQQEATWQAMRAAEDAFKAARAAWQQANRDWAQAKRTEAAKIPGEVDLFGVPS